MIRSADTPTIREATVDGAIFGMRTKDWIPDEQTEPVQGSVLQLLDVAAEISSNGNFRVTLRTVAGNRYVLEASDGVTGSPWSEVGEVRGDGKEMILNDSNATGSQRFYRVREY